MTMHVRPATQADSAAIAEIYNQGIEDRVATFETRLRTAADVAAWFDGVHPIVVAEEENQVIAFASTSGYRPRDCYQGIAEVSVYVARNSRARGTGRAVLQALIAACEEAGFWKLVSRVFLDNTASRRLIRSLGFREVGVYEKHGQLDGIWRDVLIVERLIPSNIKTRSLKEECSARPGNELVVRPYAEADEAQVIQLWRDVFPDNPAWNVPKADIQRKLTVQRELFLVGDLEGQIVATVMAGFDGHRGWVHLVAVAPACRKRGFGRVIMLEAEKRLSEIGCTKLNLQVRAKNQEVIAFYEKLGYSVEERASMGKRLS